MTLKVNQKSVKEKLRAPNKKMEQAATAAATKQINGARDQMLAEFDNHPVTKEIQGGVGSSNISGTLGGYGNLFSFVGFDKGSNPIEFLRNLIVSGISLTKKPFAKREGMYFFRVEIPTMRSLESETPLPYEKSRSWLKGIERGISGIGYFIFTKGNSSSSRSGGGLQTDKKIRGGSSLQICLICPECYKNFIKRLKLRNESSV